MSAGKTNLMSEQEKKQQEEDAYLERNYYRRNNPAKLDDVSVHSIVEDFPMVRNLI